MCKNLTNACVICKSDIEQIVPCDKRTENACIVSLFTKSKCVNEMVFTFTYHKRCIDTKVTNDKTTDDIIESHKYIP